MKLVRFSTNGQSPRLGALQGDRIADLQASLAATLTRRGVVRAADGRVRNGRTRGTRETTGFAGAMSRSGRERS